MHDFRQDFIRFTLDKQVLKFGEFITKAGRKSPYFFNAGLFNDGVSILHLSRFYAKAILDSGLKFDMLFGPAYKGITLAAGACMALAEKGRNVPFAYNRKETKYHGEGGSLIGAQLHGKVLIIDDVISAGTSVGESVKLIRIAGAEPAGVIIALDRMERGNSALLSAVQEVTYQYGVPVIAIATLEHVLDFLANNPELSAHLSAVRAYREKYGAHGS